MKRNTNIKELSKILNIEHENSIYEVIGRMEILIEFFEENPKYRHLSPFTKTYYFVTRKVAEHALENKNFYEDYNTVEKLDIQFAWLYFKALREYLIHDKIILPWKSFFTYCIEEEGYPFVQMLLGINAHINGDLAVSLNKVRYRNHNDYKSVNKILLEVIPSVMSNIAFHEKDIFGFGAVIFKDFVKQEFKDLIVKWREDAWKNFLILKENNSSALVHNIHLQTDLIGKDIIEIFRLRKVINLPQFAKTINSMKVDLE